MEACIRTGVLSALVAFLTRGKIGPEHLRAALQSGSLEMVRAIWEAHPTCGEDEQFPVELLDAPAETLEYAVSTIPMGLTNCLMGAVRNPELFRRLYAARPIRTELKTRLLEHASRGIVTTRMREVVEFLIDRRAPVSNKTLGLWLFPVPMSGPTMHPGKVWQWATTHAAASQGIPRSVWVAGTAFSPKLLLYAVSKRNTISPRVIGELVDAVLARADPRSEDSQIAIGMAGGALLDNRGTEALGERLLVAALNGLRDPTPLIANYWEHLERIDPGRRILFRMDRARRLGMTLREAIQACRASDRALGPPGLARRMNRHLPEYLHWNKYRPWHYSLFAGHTHTLAAAGDRLARVLVMDPRDQWNFPVIADLREVRVEMVAVYIAREGAEPELTLRMITDKGVFEERRLEESLEVSAIQTSEDLLPPLLGECQWSEHEQPVVLAVRP